MFKRILQTTTALATLAAGTASAAVITASSGWNGQGSVSTGGVTISACNTSGAGACSSPGLIGTRDIPGIGTGIGVQGHDNNEIDWYENGQYGSSEMLRFNFDTASVINSLELGLLFDGPEYTDVQESAKFRVSYLGGGTATYTLSTLLALPGLGLWDGPGFLGTWNGSGVSEGNSGRWVGVNPFGNQGVLQIDMFAAKGICGTRTACPDQSDYVFRSLTATAVPEPSTLALLGTALLGMGLMGRNANRRRALQSAV